jgi:Coenzyme PQQ synthesis protein D (PqqD)
MPQVMGNPRRQDFLVINDEDQTPSLLNPMSGQVFITNRVGKQVIELADGDRTVDAIVDAIARSFIGASADVVRQDVTAFLEESTEKGLISWTGVEGA